MGQWLSSSLKPENYLLLEARSAAEVLHFAKVHSRPIHVLLVQDHFVDATLAELLTRLRPGMQVVTVQHEDGPPGLSVGRALDTVRELLQPVRKVARPK